jgi:hypothetical protein
MSAAGEYGNPRPPVGRIGDHRDELLALERAQQPRQVARVEAEADSQIADRPCALADLKQHSRLRQRSTLSEVAVAEDPDPLGVVAIEPANGLGWWHHGVQDS